MDELGFVTDLTELAAKHDWFEWNKVRLIYADWLAEHKPEDEAIVRAQWVFRYERRHRGEKLQGWEVKLPVPVSVRTFQGCTVYGKVTNHDRILHFQPKSLKAQNPWEVEGRILPNISTLYFTHLDYRKTQMWFDSTVYPLGFKALFTKELADAH